MRKKIVVTGASGMVGTGLLGLIRDAPAYEVLGVYKDNQPAITGENISYLQADLTQGEGWQRLDDMQMYALVHCAAKIPKTFGVNESKDAYMVNSRMDSLALSCAISKNAKLVYISSSSVYGDSSKGICKEDSRLNPINAYAKGKSESESKILDNKSIFKYFILRLSSPYGPHQRNNTVLKLFTENALRGEPLIYHGEGQRMQDFIYVKDIARAMAMALESENSGVYNVTSGSSICMKDLAHLIKDITGSKSEVKPSGTKDMQEKYRPLFDISKAARLLNWQPLYPLEKGLAEFIEYLSGDRKS
ncbi:MAG: NAD(P)-dependent oxidoreductase [Candidatus Omnitrophica bacterium]|nr:NAD(P)-dependent oxidoreductase [Candidatus Omnitrophota bacterium]